MTISKSLKLLENLAKQNGIHQPFIVGGIPRNLIIGGPHALGDIDITTGHKDVLQLGILFADALGKKVSKSADNHVMVYDGDIKFDFSIHLTYPEIDKYLKHKGIKEPTDMQRETFSRDFTINTLMLNTDYSKQVDQIGSAVNDIRNRILRCPINCDISLGEDPKRILRAYYFKAKYDFDFSEDLKRAINKHIPALLNLNPKFTSKMINKILREDNDILDDILESGMLSFLPITKYLNNLLVKNKKVLNV